MEAAMGAMCVDGGVVYPAGVQMADFEELQERLRRRREEAAKLLKELDAALEALPRIKALAEARLFGDAETLVNQLFPGIAPSADDPKAHNESLSPAGVVKVAREVLLSTGRPLKRGALVRAIERRGHSLPGADKSKNLGTILWRHHAEFVNLDKLGYWPRDTKIEGVYDPANPPDGIYAKGYR
ncbi:hypothetical protein ACIKT0_12150 [Hansschlegelia beijingensis]|uniref:hypothetical protein n=1 Tax=Hansschlegelia beijingensis TaxID=1133344 RepID=UPI00387F1A6B